MTAPALRLDLPTDLAVVAARDEALLDVQRVGPELAGWHEDLTTADVELIAVQVGSSARVSLVVVLAPLPAGPDDVVIEGLRRLAAERAPDGEVSVLQLPVGGAVAATDIAVTQRGLAAIVVVQLPLPMLGLLLVLTLSSPDPGRLPDCAALAAAVAMRVRAA